MNPCAATRGVLPIRLAALGVNVNTKRKPALSLCFGRRKESTRSEIQRQQSHTLRWGQMHANDDRDPHRRVTEVYTSFQGEVFKRRCALQAAPLLESI